MEVKFLNQYLLIICSIGFSRFISGFIASISVPIFPTMISEIFNQSSSNASDSSYSYEHLGLLFGCKGITLLIFSPLTGIMIDKFSPNVVLLSGLVTRGVVLVIYAYGNQFYLLIVSRLMEGCYTASVSCSLDSLISSQFKGDSVLGFLYGVYYLFMFIGSSLGPVVGGILQEKYGRAMAFLTCVLLTSVEVVGVVIIMCSRKKGSHNIEIEVTESGIKESEKDFLVEDKNEGILHEINNRTLIKRKNDEDIRKEGYIIENNKIEDNLIKEIKDENIRKEGYIIESDKTEDNLIKKINCNEFQEVPNGIQTFERKDFNKGKHKVKNNSSRREEVNIITERNDQELEETSNKLIETKNRENNQFIEDKYEDGNNDDILPSKNKTEDYKNKENLLSPKNTKSSIIKDFWLFFCDPFIFLALLAQVITSASRFSYFAILPRHMLLHFQVTEFKQGAVFILSIIGYVSGFFVGGFLNMKFKSFRYIILMAFTYVNAALIMSMTVMPTWWSMSFPLCLMSFENIIFDIIISPIFVAITEKRHEKKFGILSGLKIMNLAFVSGMASLLAPIIYKKIGFTWLSFIIAISNCLYGPLFYFLRIFS